MTEAELKQIKAETEKATAKKIDWLEDGCFQAGLDPSVFFIAELIRKSYDIEADE